jgi:hypothetical protein
MALANCESGGRGGGSNEHSRELRWPPLHITCQFCLMFLCSDLEWGLDTAQSTHALKSAIAIGIC